MLRRVELLAIINKRDRATAYLYDKEFKILVPMLIKKWTSSNSQNIKSIVSLFKDTSQQPLNVHLCKIKSKLVYVKQGQILGYTFCNQTALQLALILKLPIFLDNIMILKQGITVNKDMFIDFINLNNLQC